MNCDDVFDVLTRGPFPTGAESDRAVELHLAACPECRQLAEALRPAIALFEEAIGGAAARALPGYWGELPAEARQPSVAVATNTAPSSSAAASRVNSSRVAGRSWRIAAALMIGLGVAGAVAGLGWRNNVASGEYLIAAACMTLPDQDESAPNADLSVHVRTVSTAEIARLQCCTDCHSAERKQSLSTPAVAQILLTCNLCHTE
jgi:hypothetical protein